MLVRSLLLALAGISAASGLPSIARADDGAYGRLDGDLDLRLGAGAALGSGGPSLAAHTAALYLGMVGPYLLYTDALGSERPAFARSLAVGLHVQPLFLGRFALDLTHGPATFDLLVDSFAIDIGAVWHAPRSGSMAATPGLEVGLGLGVPLLARATGPFLELRGALRWRAADLEAPTADLIDRGALLTLTLAWHQMVMADIVDARDGRIR